MLTGKGKIRLGEMGSKEKQERELRKKTERRLNHKRKILDRKPNKNEEMYRVTIRFCIRMTDQILLIPRKYRVNKREHNKQKKLLIFYELDIM